VLHLSAGGRRLVVQMAEPFEAARADALLSARVRVRGVCRSLLTEKGQLADTALLSPGRAALTLVHPAPTELFSLPVRPIDTLLQFVPDQSWEQPVHVRGTVTYAHAGRLFVRDPTGGVQVEVMAPTLPEVGDDVQVVGFASPGDYSPVLQDAVFRVARPGAPPAAQPITPDQALSGRLDGALVELEATFLESVRSGEMEQLLLEAGPFRFTAALPRSPEAPLRLRPGSGLRLTGIFLVNVGEQRLPQGFRLLLRGPHDVVVRRAASWWTVGRALWVVGGLGAVVVLALAWIVTLRRQVAAQSRVIWNRMRRETELEERHRMARELHDTLEQNLTGTCLALEAADLSLVPEPQTAARHLKKAIAQVRESIKAVHRSVWALRDEGASERDLAAALAAIGRELSSCGAVPIEVVARTTGVPRAFPVAVENDLLRIGQEALTNAVRHGHATHIEIDLTHAADHFRLRVRDDGRGFDAQAPVPAGHFGLLGMRERAEAIGARLSVSSLPHRGTEVMVILPSEAPALRQVG
jgi:signal transduction histidine kinase